MNAPLPETPAAETPAVARPTLTPVLLALLALLSAFTPLSIDMYLPALPVIAIDLHGTAGDIQLTLSAFMIAFGVGQIFYGPAGDRFGRRPVILTGLCIYMLTSIGCAFAGEAMQLVALRFLQGLAACGGVVLARTMVRDLAEREQAARAMSLMMACTSIAPMLAPLLGGQILWFLGWRAVFWTLALIGVIAFIFSYFRLPETLRPEYRQPLVLTSILKRFGELLRHRAFMGYAFTTSFMFSALLSFISGSPFVLIERYGVAPRNYGLIFGGMIVFMTIGSLLNARFVRRLGPDRILRYAVYVPLLSGVASLVLGQIEARYGTIGMWPIIACFAPQIATISLIGPNSMVMALQRYPHMAGTASSLMGVMQFGLGAIFGAVVGQTYVGTIGPMTLAMGIAGILCFASNRLLVGRAG
jgi:DHA1 family bicyclomycin/chloramphenicol resistance-like MFS transporter